MTNARIQDLREEINFLRSQVLYLVNSGNEKEQGRKFTMKLGRISEQIETAIGLEPTQREQNLFDWAFSNWRMAADKFQ